MLTKDLFEKIRRIEITTSRLVTDIFAGQYHSVFKGRGMEFDEVREYQMGDDIRFIDWNVTARTGKAHIKKFVEERELTMMILVDVSQSCHFATEGQFKNKIAAEIAAVLAFSAIRNNDRVGLLMFTDTIELFISPQKGKGHVLRLIREMLYFKPKSQGTDLNKALEYLNHVIRRKAVVFVLSDFFESSQTIESSFKKTLKLANKRHDVIAITLNDPRELNLVDCGIIELKDAECDGRVVIDSSDARVQSQYNRRALERYSKRTQLFRSCAVDHIDVSTGTSYEPALVNFFKQRQHRAGL